LQKQSATDKNVWKQMHERINSAVSSTAHLLEKILGQLESILPAVKFTVEVPGSVFAQDLESADQAQDRIKSLQCIFLPGFDLLFISWFLD
jgi:hypothetical protein